MSSGQHTPYSKIQKPKRSSLNRPQSATIMDSDFSTGFRSDIENDPMSLAYKTRLHSLFSQIEKEFDLLYQENQHLQDKIEMLNEKLEKDTFDKPDCVDFESNFSKALTKKLSSSSQKSKTAHKLKAQTSKIVSSFKAPLYNSAVLKEFVGHKDGVWEVSVARPGVPVIGTASADHTACIWSVDSSKCLLQYQGHSGSVNSVRFHPSKDLVLTGSGDWSAHIWQAVLNWDLPKGHSSEEELEETELVGTEEGGDMCAGAHLRGGATLRTPIGELGGHVGAVAAAEWLAGADTAITAGWDRIAILHDVESCTQITTLTGHDQELTHTATHPTQKLAVTSSRDTTFRLWDFRETVPAVSVFQGHTESVTSAVFARDDKVVSSSDDRSVKVWDLRNMRSPAATIRVDSAVNRLSVSANGVIAIPHDNRHIRLFDLNGVRLARLPRSSRQGHNRMVACVTWADDVIGGVNLFSCGFDRRVLGWSVTSLKD
ncbi:WD repeat-containing protein 37 [Anthonomus grandis grandis]|uniref:WD repeat-containing protein 37 n=1 Tax=Anthonomus grandis grandis TaxID=2921223 RepID=UPI0021669B7F|nr:WD repeat-containing protein 37 [Anthonomus grandis grandis]XP_050311883.1 WD repeat-containing protein 37 [Anthonomus grandis grandis]